MAYWLLTNIAAIGSTLILIVVALFLAAGLNPAVTFFERRGLRRSYAVLVVIICVLIAVVLFLVAIVPVITDQVRSITDQAPQWFDRLQNNQRCRTSTTSTTSSTRLATTSPAGTSSAPSSGVRSGIGLAVLGALFNAFIILVLTLYFLSSLDTTKNALYRLAPASRRDRVSRLGNRIIESVGGYVSGAFIVAMCAGISSVVFLFAVGLGEYAVALAFVVALLDVIPMIGATIGAVVVTADRVRRGPEDRHRLRDLLRRSTSRSRTTSSTRA